MYEKLMVSVSGVRGRVGDGLTPAVISKFAAGFGAWALSHGGSKTIVVGRDSRVSGPMFHRATIAALQSVGCDVLDVGLAPTPTIQMAVEDATPPGDSHHREPQPDRVERAQVHRAERAVPECGGGRRDARGRRKRGHLRDMGRARHDAGHRRDRAAHSARPGLPFIKVDRIRERAFGSRWTRPRRRRRDHSAPVWNFRMRSDGRSTWRPTAGSSGHRSHSRPTSATWNASCQVGAESAWPPTRTSTDWRSFPTPGRRSGRITRSHSRRVWSFDTERTRGDELVDQPNGR